jgi:glucokinase
VGLIDRGRLLTGANSCVAGGHMVIGARGRKCNCGNSGCLEQYASMSSLIKRANREKKANADSVLNRYAKLDGINIFEAEKPGDYSAKKVVNEFIYYLGEGIISILNLMRPDAVVIGGGISKQGEYLTEKLLKSMGDKTFAKKRLAQYKVTFARLGNMAGVLGAKLLFDSGLKNDCLQGHF